jgi:pimeloyl-ACP methyl ester carboxylesterase
VKPLTEPEDAANNQPFHLVIPSLPGLGFSDPLPNNTPIIFTIAEVLNTLMNRLSYSHYLATNSGAGSQSPAEIDWKLVNTLATRYPASCLGAHFIAPPLTTPKISEAPWEWTKWSIANFFRAGILGYDDSDFQALNRTYVSWSIGKRPPTPQQFGLNKLGLTEPNTLAYALCDSPIGLLVFVMKGLRALGPTSNFTPEQVITFTELAWLPGPEYAMRFWAYCATHNEEEERKEQEKKAVAQAVKPRVAITVFLGGKDSPVAPQGDVELAALPPPVPTDDKQKYVCPAWGNAHYNVVHTQRVAGKPGLLAWEQPEVVFKGVRGLAKQILRVDKRLAPATTAGTSAAEPVPLQKVVVIPASDSSGNAGGPSTPANALSPITDSDATPKPRLLVPEPARPGLAPTPSGQKDSEQTVVSTSNKDVFNTSEDKGKGKDLDMPKKPFSEGSTPDTPVSAPSPIAAA